MLSTLILILFIFFVLVPLLRAVWGGYKLHSQWKKATSGLRDAYAKARQAAQPGPKKRRKKIDPSVGEYVAFEEIAVSQTTAGSQEFTAFKAEEQVEDAVWEDV